MLLLAAVWTAASAQTVKARVYYTDDEGENVETTDIEEGQAPLEATFRANPENLGYWTASYEWHFYKISASEGRQELFVRYEEDTQYRFVESGNYQVLLNTYLYNGNDTIILDADPINIEIVESWLEFPNAFSPNDDLINDVFKAKDGKKGNSKGYKSIVEFHAYIFNRYGQKLFEWTDIKEGWDGKYHGKPVKEGVYFLLCRAKGADGKEYNIRKDINLLRSIRNNEQ